MHKQKLLCFLRNICLYFKLKLNQKKRKTIKGKNLRSKLWKNKNNTTQSNPYSTGQKNVNCETIIMHHFRLCNASCYQPFFFGSIWFNSFFRVTFSNIFLSFIHSFPSLFRMLNRIFIGVWIPANHSIHLNR